MECPYCGIHLSIDGVDAYHTPINFASTPSHALGLETRAQDKQFTVSAHKCPECTNQVIWLNHLSENEAGQREVFETTLVYPKFRSALLPEEVPREYAEEYREAKQTLDISPEASGALSRRALQRLIREKEGIKERSLFKEIKQLLALNKLPTYLAQDLDSIRNVGNFAAHASADLATGEIIPVETGEAEWTLSVLEALLTFYFVDLGKSAARRAALNEKLRKAGKDPMLGS